MGDMKKNKNNLILAIFFLAWGVFLLSFLLHNSGNYLDPDLGWHLTIGQQIITQRAVPQVERINYPILGESWVDHEWFSDMILYFLFDQVGYVGLEIIFAFLFVLTLLMLTIFIKNNFLPAQAGLGTTLGLGFLGLLAMSPHLGVRIQEFALLFLLSLIIILHYYSKTKNLKYLLWLLPLFFIWANIHGSFLIGLAVLGFWLIIKIIEYLLQNKKIFLYLQHNHILAKPALLKAAGLVALSGLVTLLTPYGLKLYFFLSEYSNSFYLLHIAEWLPAWHYPINYYQLIYLAIVVATLIFLAQAVYQKEVPWGQTERREPYKINLWYLALALLFLVLSFKSKRHFPLFFIASFPIISEFIVNYFVLPVRQLKFIKFFIWSKLIPLFLALILFLTATLILLKTNYPTQPFSSPVFCQGFPCAAIEYIKNSQYRDYRIFNNYGWGGFIIQVWPGKELFIDGRLPIKEINNHSFLEEYYGFFNEDTLAGKLKEYEVELVLLKLHPPINLNWFEKYVLGLREDKFNDKENRLQNYLQSQADWRLKYEDLISQVYVKE